MPFPEDEGVTREEAAAYLLELGSTRAYALGGRPVGLGRDPVNYVTMREPTVSRFHGEIRYDPTAGGFSFHSMGAHGSTVNGSPVGEPGLTLQDGDVVEIQGTALKFTTSRPPASYRILARADQVPLSPSTPTPPLQQRSVEPPTTGLEATDPRRFARDGRRRWGAVWLIAIAVLVVAAVLILLYLRRGTGHSA